MVKRFIQDLFHIIPAIMPRSIAAPIASLTAMGSRDDTRADIDCRRAMIWTNILI